MAIDLLKETGGGDNGVGIPASQVRARRRDRGGAATQRLYERALDPIGGKATVETEAGLWEWSPKRALSRP